MLGGDILLIEKTNGASIPVEEVIGTLLDGRNLEKLVGNATVACFALVREIVSPKFYQQLVENTDTVDAIIREHVAFIVFYGSRSQIAERENKPPGFGGRQINHQVEGLSVSLKNGVDMPAFEFGKLAEILLKNPAKVNGQFLSHCMAKAASALMERYGINESDLPCLLFVAPSNPKQCLFVALNSEDPLSSLYTNVLRPLSDAFRQFSDYWICQKKIGVERSVNFAVRARDLENQIELLREKQRNETFRYVERIKPLKETMERLERLDHRSVTDLKKELEGCSYVLSLGRRTTLDQYMEQMKKDLSAILEIEAKIQVDGEAGLEEENAVLVERKTHLRHCWNNVLSRLRKSIGEEIVKPAELSLAKNCVQETDLLKALSRAQDLNQISERKSQIAADLREKGYTDMALYLEPSPFRVVEEMLKLKLLGFNGHLPQTQDMLSEFSRLRSEVKGACDQFMALRGETIERFDMLNATTGRILADVNDMCSALLHCLIDEAKDGPRLFSFVPIGPSFLDRPKWISQKFRLTLWCEHSRLPLPVLNGENSKAGVYELNLPREWFEKAAPFLKMLTGTLSLVLPVAAAAGRLVVDDTIYKGLEKDLDLGEKSVESVLKAGDASTDWLDHKDAPQLKPGEVIQAQGAVLRQLHAWLREKDPSFGGLVRVQNQRCEFVWVHSQFANKYRTWLPKEARTNTLGAEATSGGTPI